jgi:hypothetical protein
MVVGLFGGLLLFLLSPPQAAKNIKDIVTTIKPDFFRGFMVLLGSCLFVCFLLALQRASSHAG